NPVGGFIGRLNQETTLAISNLPPDAADITAHNGCTLPHRFRNRKTEPLADRFLHYNRSAALQRIHQNRVINGQDNNALVNRTVNGLEYDLAFRIVDGAIANEHKRAIHLPTSLSQSLNYAQRIV